MTRSNLYITLSNGDAINCVADSSSTPEQGYIVENLIIPLLSYSNAENELALLKEHCILNELRINADYRYEINLRKETVAFYDEMYFFKTGVFRKGENLTRRYIAYLEKIQNETVMNMFKGYSNQALIQRANSLPDFKWDDEGVELRRRSLLSNGAFIYTMRGNSLIILKDN
jgi:DNA-binding Lrp family transcriptional regulator